MHFCVSPFLHVSTNLELWNQIQSYDIILKLGYKNKLVIFERNFMKNILIYGSTGSIGTQTIDVIRKNKDKLSVFGIVANSNYKLVYEQIVEFKPRYACLIDEEAYGALIEILKGEFELKGSECYIDGKIVNILQGQKSAINMVRNDGYDTIVTATVGISGLLPTMEAIYNSKTIALANKETLVTAGDIVMKEAKKHNAKIIPVDSEHSAIFQSLNGENIDDVHKLILTASGGPFRYKTREQIKNVTKDEALKHPNWSMGRKISIDSATLMNKGLEIIEAKWLFGVEEDMIEVIVHPQSIIHSMVEYNDSSIIAQLGTADMRTAIQYALLYPIRNDMGIERLNFLEVGSLEFFKPDEDTFPCLKLAKRALREGMISCTILNAANEVLVDMFLNDEIGFYDIPKYIEMAMDEIELKSDPSIDDIIIADEKTREFIRERVR